MGKYSELKEHPELKKNISGRAARLTNLTAVALLAANPAKCREELEKRNYKMFDYKVSKDGVFQLVLVDESFSIEENGMWTDGTRCGSVTREIDYERNILRFSLSSTKVWKEEISRYYVRGEEMDRMYSPSPMTINKESTVVVKEYEIPLRKEDQPRNFGEGRLCYYTTRNRGGILVDVSTKRMVAAWVDKKACWVKGKDIDVSKEGRFKAMPSYRKKMAEFQGFVLENTGTYDF